MKRISFFLCALLLLSTAVRGQSWEKVQIDSAVTVELPKGSTINDADGKFSLYAQSPFGAILIFKEEDHPRVTPDIEKEKHLLDYYQDYISNVRKSSKDAIIKDEKDLRIGELRVKDFTLQTDSGSGVVYRDFRILHANSATYTFEFLYQDIHKDYALQERDRFFNSIQVDEELEAKDQFTSTEFNSEVNPDSSGLWLMLGLGSVFLLLLIIWLVRRRRR